VNHPESFVVLFKESPPLPNNKKYILPWFIFETWSVKDIA
jgi:hypothetical protein